MDDPLLPSSMGKGTKLAARLAALSILGFILATAISAIVKGAGDSVDSGYIGVSIALFCFLGTTLFMLKWFSDDSLEDRYKYLSMVQVVASLIACASLMAVMFTAAPTTYHVGGWIHGNKSISSPVQISFREGQPPISLVPNQECTAFMFPQKYSDGASYEVVVKQARDPAPPQTVTCSTSYGKGKVSGAIVNNIGLNCKAVNSYAIGGTLGGLGEGLTLVLKMNDESLPIVSNGGFTFRNKVATGQTYRVTVATQPTGQTCSVTNGQGSVGEADITNVVVSCSR